MLVLAPMRFPLATILTLSAAILGLLSSLDWVGQPFPGFLVLENGVVASAGLGHWPAVEDGAIYQAEIIAVDGAPFPGVDEFKAWIETLPVGETVTYQFRSGGQAFEREIVTRGFESIDFFLLFGLYLLGGLAMCGVGLALIFMRRSDPVAEGTAVALWVIGMWALTATDLYGPYRLFRLHAGLECFLFAGCLHLAATFPYPHRMLQRSPKLLAAPYVLGAVLAIAVQTGLYSPAWYVPLHRLAIGLLGLSLAVLILSQVLAWIAPPTFQARQRVKVLMIGIVLACAPNLALAVGSALTGGRVAENAFGFSGIFLPLAIGYAVLHTNLFEVDTFLRRTLNYGATSMVLTGLYAAALVAVDRLIQDGTDVERGQLLIATSALALFALLPLRDRLQSSIDRLFFRNVVDLRHLIDVTSERLASVADLEVITREITDSVQRAVQPEWATIEVFKTAVGDGPACAFGTMPEGFDELRSLSPDDTADGMAELDRALAIPMRVEGRLVARLLVGPRRSGRFFDGEDRRFLRTLCNHGSIAIENAMAIEQLRSLNQSLEQKVADRTADLSSALEDLRETQDHLVHQEKLASVGRLVAGIAHEINNPVNFVDGNLVFLKEHVDVLHEVIQRYEQAVLTAAPALESALQEIAKEAELDYVLEDLSSIIDACQEGLNRTTTIVRDLRTFSRSDSRRAGRVDLQEAFESTISLLRGRFSDVELVREFEDVPPIFAVEGQIKQVLMNLVHNALDAMEDHGRLTLRLHFEGGRIIAEVEDDGPGIQGSDIERIFDPFFTTKETGKGTGLGLAISYGVIADHDGSLRVASEPGKTCFTIELPLGTGPSGDSRGPDA